MLFSVREKAELYLEAAPAACVVWSEWACVYVCAHLCTATVWCGNHLDSARNLPISVTQWAGRYPQGHMAREKLSGVRYTVQFKLIGKHFTGFWNINHRS